MLCALLLNFAMQAGDRQNDDPQIENWRQWEIPPAPALSAEEELKSFRVADGFEVELVAAEPLVVDPVAACFDEYGRLWVVEMRGFMRDVDGSDEDAPVGKIVVLEDLDGDGRMDKSTTYLDKLVLPRALSLVKDGLLVIAPPHLLFCEDLDGDLVSDRQTIISDDWGGIYSPEHAPNGLVHGIDNRIHFAKHNQEAIWKNGKWQSFSAPAQGQWGVSMDSTGRLYFNSNSSLLHTDLVPRIYARRNPAYRGLKGLGVKIMHDQRVWPGRVTPGINRAYRPGTLREDGTLLNTTGACGPGVVRGSAMPDHAVGSILVPDPCANLIKQLSVKVANGSLIAQNSHGPGQDFWTSTDERFRPVNVIDGPDGATYVLDFYRGFIQHRLFVTSYLRKQALERGLDKPIGLGRIWRVKKTNEANHGLPAANNEMDWLKLLNHKDGFWRDTAQRLLVDSDAENLVAPLEQIVKTSRGFGGLHALWTLQGRGELSVDTAEYALSSLRPRFAVSAIRACEEYLMSDDGTLSSLLAERSKYADNFYKRQALLSLLASPKESAQLAALDIWFENLDDSILRSCLPTTPQDYIPLLLKLLQQDERLNLNDKKQREIYDVLVATATTSSQGASDFSSEVFLRTCAACHGTDGLGQTALAPPLNDSHWLQLPKEKLIEIVLDGLQEKIEVNGQEWDMLMPGWGAILNDEEIAEVLNAIQSQFSPEPQKFIPGEVGSIRGQ